MDNSANSKSNKKVKAGDELRKQLTEIVNKHETDENLEILATKLSEEWKKPASKKPELSFAKFTEKLKNRKR